MIEAVKVIGLVAEIASAFGLRHSALFEFAKERIPELAKPGPDLGTSYQNAKRKALGDDAGG